MALKNFALTKKDQIGQERCENEDNKRGKTENLLFLKLKNINLRLAK